jgi:hypothetical protein
MKYIRSAAENQIKLIRQPMKSIFSNKMEHRSIGDILSAERPPATNKSEIYKHKGYTSEPDILIGVTDFWKFFRDTLFEQLLATSHAENGKLTTGRKGQKLLSKSQ